MPSSHTSWPVVHCMWGTACPSLRGQHQELLSQLSIPAWSLGRPNPSFCPDDLSVTKGSSQTRQTGSLSPFCNIPPFSSGVKYTFIHNYCEQTALLHSWSKDSSLLFLSITSATKLSRQHLWLSDSMLWINALQWLAQYLFWEMFLMDFAQILIWIRVYFLFFPAKRSDLKGANVMYISGKL